MGASARSSRSGKRGKHEKREKHPAGAAGRTRVGLIYLSIIAIAFILYGNTLKHDYTLDDVIVNKGNRFVQEGLAGIGDILSHGFLYGYNGRNDQSYRPITLITLAVERQFFNNDPHPSHVVNVALYALIGVLLFRLLRKLFRGYNVMIPLSITALYLVHPVHTEVVASIKSRDEILALLFIVLSLTSLAAFRLSSRKRDLVLSLVFYFLALLSKEVALTMLAVVPLLLYFFFDEKPKRIAYLSLPFAAVLTVYMLLRSAILDSITFSGRLDIINNSLMAAQTTGERLATNFVILGKYLSLCFIPYPLSCDYSYNQIPIVSFSDPSAVLSLCVYIALAAYAAIGAFRKDKVAFGILFFFITLSISSNLFIKIGATLGERFLFTPTVGISVFLVLVLFRCFRVDPASPAAKRHGPLIVLLTIMVAYAVITIDRNKDWANDLALASSAVRSSPNSARSQAWLGSEYMALAKRDRDPGVRKRHLEEAVRGLTRSIEIYPAYPLAQFNLGLTYALMGDQETALKSYLNTLKYDPGHLKAMNNIGVYYFDKNQLDSALVYFGRVVSMDGSDPAALLNLGVTYQKLGRLEEAVVYYRRAHDLYPSDVKTLRYLIKAYGDLGDTAQVDRYTRELSTYQPDGGNPAP